MLTCHVFMCICLLLPFLSKASPAQPANAVQVSPPRVNMEAPLQLLCTNLDYDEHKGRIAIGRITSGRINKAETVVVCKPGARLTVLQATQQTTHCRASTSTQPRRGGRYTVWAVRA